MNRRQKKIKGAYNYQNDDQTHNLLIFTFFSLGFSFLDHSDFRFALAIFVHSLVSSKFSKHPTIMVTFYTPEDRSSFHSEPCSLHKSQLTKN